jgi:arsenate reductase (thioredoxin)
MMNKPSILVLCTGNSARSQMAEAWLRRAVGAQYDVYSAGITPKGLHPRTIEVMDEAGIDVRHHTSDSIEKYFGQPFRYVITVCGHADANCPVALWHKGEKLHWPFDDPAAESDPDAQLASFRRVRDEIRAKVEAWAAEQG